MYTYNFRKYAADKRRPPKIILTAYYKTLTLRLDFEKKSQKKGLRNVIIDFSVENYRSIRKAVTLSAIAQSTSEPTVTIPFVSERRKLALLPVVGIFGANASGKSNVLAALDRLLDMASMVGASRPDPLSPMESFAFKARYRKLPTKLAVRILLHDIVYEYQLNLFRSQIVYEKLSYIAAESSRNVSRLIFERSSESNNDVFEWKVGADLPTLFSRILKATTGNRTFLGVMINDFTHPVTEVLRVWIEDYFLFDNSLGLETNIENCGFILNYSAPELKGAVLGLVKRFDTGVSDFAITEMDEGWHDIEVSHVTEDKSNISWSIDTESLGTQKLFVLATKCLLALQTGRAVIFDEFSASIHATIARTIIMLFQNRRINRYGAQLFFASHDVSLQKSKVLQRDQIWFTEKKNDGSTDLFPLTSFGVRKDLVIDKAYTEGRFGAVPFLPTDIELENFLVKAIHGVCVKSCGIGVKHPCLPALF